MTEPARLYRSNTNSVIAIAGWVTVAGAAVLVIALAPGAPWRLWVLVPLVLVAVLLFELFWRPRIHWNDEHITLVDPFRTVEIPWSMVVDIDTRFAMTVVTPRRRYRSSAAPAAGALSRPRVGRDSVGPDQRGGIVRKSDALGTDSGDAAYLVRSAWNELVEQQRIPLGRAATDRVTITLHIGTTALTAVMLAASIAAVLNL